MDVSFGIFCQFLLEMQQAQVFFLYKVATISWTNIVNICLAVFIQYVHVNAEFIQYVHVNAEFICMLSYS